jgi:hypothetical protein
MSGGQRTFQAGQRGSYIVGKVADWLALGASPVPDSIQDALDWLAEVLAGGGGGGGLLQAFPRRLDVSVNGANVDNAQSHAAVMTTRTNVNAAGGFNGGGTGNKAMLGVQGLHHMPLAALVSLAFQWKELEAELPNPLALRVYANVLIEPDPVGFPGVFKVLVFSDALVPIVTMDTTSIGAGSWLETWPTAAGPARVQCVNPAQPPGPPVSVWTSPGPGVPYAVATANIWQAQSFDLADVLAAYPNARLADCASGDGGLPKSPSTTPALLLIVGDSNNHALVSRLVQAIEVNGGAV